MTPAELTLVGGLRMAASSLVKVEDLTDEALAALLSFTRVLAGWLETADAEAVSRARNDVKYPGYRLKESPRRRITDPDAALEAIRRSAPDYAPLCQRTELLGVKELTRRLGKARFDEILAPFIGTVMSYRLVPEGE